jgi:hypothetical protein
MTRPTDLCRNCEDARKFHCPECGACYSEPATSHTAMNGAVMKYPRYCGNENNCDIADKYEGIVAKRRAKYYAKTNLPNGIHTIITS